MQSIALAQMMSISQTVHFVIYILSFYNFDQYFQHKQSKLQQIKMNVQNKEFTYIGIGCLTIGCLAYFYKQYREQRDFYRYKKHQVKQTCKQYYGEDYKKGLLQNFKSSYFVEQKINKHQINHLISLRQTLKKNGKKVSIFLPYIKLDKDQKSDIYQRFYRNLHPIQIQTIRANPFQEQKAGGRFNIFKFENKQTAKVQINNCNIQRLCLKQKLQSNIIFQQNKKKSTNSYNLTYTLQRFLSMSIYGSISYSVTHSCFVIDPEFIMASRPTADDFDRVIDKIIQYWDTKEKNTHLKKIIIACFIGTAFYIFVYRGFKSLWKKYIQKKQISGKAAVNYFLNKPCFQASKLGKLVCQQCKKKNVQVVYECGHLSLCQDCNELNKEKMCPLCKKVSKKQLRVFL